MSGFIPGDDLGLVGRDLRVSGIAASTATNRRANTQAVTIATGTVTNSLTFAPGATWRATAL